MIMLMIIFIRKIMITAVVMMITMIIREWMIDHLEIESTVLHKVSRQSDPK